MAGLGEAYVSIHADLRPFAKELKAQAKPILDQFEKGLEQAGGKGGGKAGLLAGKNASDGFKRSGFFDSLRGGLVEALGQLGTVLDNGISSLPVEVKAAIIGGILLAAPAILAFLGGAIAAAVGIGVAGLGIALASQFDTVQTRATSFLSNLRDTLVASASGFVQPILNSFDLFDEALIRLGPKFTELFGSAATFVEPLTRGIIRFLDQFIPALTDAINHSQGFIDTFADGLEFLGEMLGDFVSTLAATGTDGEQALRDLLTILGLLIEYTSQLINLSIRLYANFRRMIQDIPGWIQAIFPTFKLIENVFDQLDEAFADADTSANTYAYTNVALGTSVVSVISATDAETKALKEAQKAVDDLNEALFGLIDSHIAFEQSLDDLDEALRKNGDAFDFEGQKGRDNLKAVGTAIKNAQREAREAVDAHKLNNAEAQALYDREIEKIFAVGKAHGLTRDEINAVYGEVIKLLNLPPIGGDLLTGLSGQANALTGALERALNAAHRLRIATGRPIGGTGGFQEFGDGAILDQPTVGIFGEAGREVVIPMTKPARAAQLAEQSGLTKLLGGGAQTVIAIFDGEPFQARIVKTVAGFSSRQAQQLSYGTRG